MEYSNRFVRSPFRGRDNFGMFLTSLGMRGMVAEVGVHHGVFAKQLLSQWRGEMYVGIDFWQPVQGLLMPSLPGETPQAKDRDRLRDMSLAASNLKDVSTPCCLLKATSEHAARLFANEAFDFIYIDGDHSREAVEADLRRWWPKVRNGGILAGHDLCMPQVRSFDWNHIKDVVDHFFEDKCPWVNVVEDDDGPWSWYVRKG